MAIKTYTIKNKRGEVLGELHFDPLSDIAVLAYRTMFIDIKEMLEPLKNISINAKGEAETITDAATLQVVEDKLREAFDTSFGNGAYNSFFSQIRPFASQNGTFYAANVIRSIDTLVTQEAGKDFVEAVDSALNGDSDALDQQLGKRKVKGIDKFLSRLGVNFHFRDLEPGEVIKEADNEQ